MWSGSRVCGAQRGVAVVTALLLTTLAVTIVAGLFWQQQVQVRSIENQRLQLQKEWILRGALDWARLILRSDAQKSKVDHLDEPWATPLANTRLDQYAEDGQTGSDAGDAVLSGNIVDAQGRYNLTNLCASGAVDPKELAVLTRLLSNLHLPSNLAKGIAGACVAPQPAVAKPPPNQPGQPVVPVKVNDDTKLPLLQVEDLLTLPNVTQQIVDKLKDFIVVLPVATPINVNTASVEVIAARFEEISLADAASLVAGRSRAYFKDAEDFKARFFGTKLGTVDPSKADVATHYFLVNGKVRIGRAALNTLALIHREDTRTDVVWVREQ